MRRLNYARVIREDETCEMVRNGAKWCEMRNSINIDHRSCRLSFLASTLPVDFVVV